MPADSKRTARYHTNNFRQKKNVLQNKHLKAQRADTGGLSV